jgi:hypothetical protein
MKRIFETSSIVPAARGCVKVSRDRNKNYVIKIQLSNLAEPERLQPPKKTYVVWIVTEENSTHNLGQLKSKIRCISRRLKAYLETVSSIKPAKIFITAEDVPEIEVPVTQAVLTTKIF